LYQLVGEDWDWVDKHAWSDEAWRSYAENDNLRTWVAYCKGSPAGYYELQQQQNGDVEIAYFGLASRFIGRGFGGYLLSEAIAFAWAGTRRVWVHTCTLDHPRALQNYKARGLEVYRVETTEEGHNRRITPVITWGAVSLGVNTAAQFLDSPPPLLAQHGEATLRVDLSQAGVETHIHVAVNLLQMKNEGISIMIPPALALGDQLRHHFADHRRVFVLVP